MLPNKKDLLDLSLISLKLIRTLICFEVTENAKIYQSVHGKIWTF